MKEQDIEIYLAAKNTYSYGNIICLVVVAISAIVALTTFLPSLQQFSKYIVLAALVIGTSTYGLGVKSYITRKDLLGVLDRKIRSDAEALKYIASKSNNRKSKNA